MEIKGKVHCFFEQSGTFKNEFINLGIPDEDYDIQNNFGQTDHEIDLFAEIEQAYWGGQSIFDGITKDDLIVAFFPCIHFCGISQTWFSLTQRDYAKWDYKRIIDNVCKKNKQLLYNVKVTGHTASTPAERRRQTRIAGGTLRAKVI